MRAWMTRLHRWAGLFMAAFLFVAGLTGAVISWDHELDEWLNPQLFDAPAPSPEARKRGALELVDGLEAADPRLRVAFAPLEVEDGHALGVSVVPRVDPATGQPHVLGFNQVTLNPYTGEVQGTRLWGAVSLSRENLMPFLYKLHYSMHIPNAGALELGTWFMGMVSMVWVLDCFLALCISLPGRRAWRKSWRKSFSFRWRQGGHKRTFDLHRAGGLWAWALLLTVAITSVSMNLRREVVRPLVERVSTLTPDIFALRAPVPVARFVEPGIRREEALALARQEAGRRGWTAPAGAVFYSAPYKLYGVNFFEPGDDHASWGLGNPWLYLDAQTGAYLGDRVPGTGTAGDVFLQAQLPLHTGRIAGTAGRVTMSVLGLGVAMLSVTGVMIWARKRRAALRGKACRAALTGIEHGAAKRRHAGAA